jgi:type I restriction enzyme R subunit
MARLFANSEWVTRKQLADKALRSAGWRVTPQRDQPLSMLDRCAVEEVPTSNGPADYAINPKPRSQRVGLGG